MIFQLPLLFLAAIVGVDQLNGEGAAVGVEDQGVEIVVDAKSLLFLLGAQIDYEVTPLHAKFVFRNPNETDACGCGESVTIVPAAAQ